MGHTEPLADCPGGLVVRMRQDLRQPAAECVVEDGR
jgi:hypothetical protein